MYCCSGRRQTALVVAKGNSEVTPSGAPRASGTANQTEATIDTGAMSSGSEDVDAGEGGSGTNRNMSGHNDTGAESASGQCHCVMGEAVRSLSLCQYQCVTVSVSIVKTLSLNLCKQKYT